MLAVSWWGSVATWVWWTPLGVVAQLVSLGALVFAIREVVRSRRQVPLVVLSYDLFGVMRRDGQAYHLLEITNSGRGPALFHYGGMVGARPVLFAEHRAPRVLGSGASFTLAVTSTQIQDAWLIVIYGDHEDRGTVNMRWEPLTPAGALGKRYNADIDEWDSRTRTQRFKDRHWPRPVGPGSAPWATFRSSKEAATFRRRLLQDQDLRYYPFTQVELAPPSDLPYVKHPDEF
ncbi:hypothetical protein [Microbacterium sp. ZW T5_56]|uniref:hypothetical protein n=1 Tax=Microbacterium sp. ZW T5_56 TaxID=3378081 RepID=UPI003853474E